LHESFTIKWWLSSKTEGWNFAKNKLKKFVNSMKMEFTFASLILNVINYSEESTRKLHLFWMML